LLEGFEFNIGGKLGTTLFAPFTGTIDRAAGTLVINIPSFVPLNMVAAPNGSTHFKIISGGAAVDFENEKFEAENQETALIAWDSNATEAIALTSNVAANNTHPMFLVLGIEFYQDVNGYKYPLKNGAYNALCLIKVSGV
jgi:hypothetical protein